jgi:hypothetical protein
MAAALLRAIGHAGSRKIGMNSATEQQDGAPGSSASREGVQSATGDAKASASRRLVNAILDVVGRPPDTKEPRHDDPQKRARWIANRTAAKAAVSAGTLALPPGPLGWLTILPELETVWRQQAQMVADIAGSFGKSATLDREQMLYCLFRHIAPAAFREMVSEVRDEAGERVVIREASPRTLRAIVQKIGLRVSLRLMGKGISRWVPVVGALGVGAYAYYDTGQVAATAMSLFSKEIDIDSAADDRGEAAPADGAG